MNSQDSQAKAKLAIKRFHEAGLEPKVIALAEKAAKLGRYDESIGLLDNLLQMGSENKKMIATLAIKFQKQKEDKEAKKEESE